MENSYIKSSTDISLYSARDTCVHSIENFIKRLTDFL